MRRFHRWRDDVKVQEVEERINTRITGLEHQETRLHEWLDCIRQVGAIAEKMGYARPKDQVEEGGLAQAFEELVEQADLDETSSVEVDLDVMGETHLESEQPVEQEEGPKLSQPEELDEEGVEELREEDAELPQSEELEEFIEYQLQEPEDEKEKRLEVPDEDNLDQLRAALSSAQGKNSAEKKSISSFLSAFLSADEE